MTEVPVPYKIRKAHKDDHDRLFDLYKSSSLSTFKDYSNKITEFYIQKIADQSLKNGVTLVAEREDDKGEFIAVVTSIPLGINPSVSHVLTDLTIVIHNDFQKLGLGKEMIQKYMNIIKQDFNNIGIVEFFIRETSLDAIKYFESIGFKQQGKLDGRIKTSSGYEAEVILSWINPNYEEK